MKETLNKITKLRSSFNVLFQEIIENKLSVMDIENKEVLEVFLSAINAMQEELIADSAIANYAELAIKPDAIDYLNLLSQKCNDLATILEESLFEVLTAKDFFLETNKETKIFLLEHSNMILENSGSIISDYLKILSKNETIKSRLHPDLSQKLTSTKLFANIDDDFDALKEKALKLNPFHKVKAFRYFNSNFESANLANIRKLNEFYGYNGVRKQYKEFFNNFAYDKETSNVPLLITSLPGLGKTHLTISNVINNPDLTLILPEPLDLEKGLELLIKKLSLYKNNKFVVFFDDIDTRTIEWYYFRANVGGSFSLPDNIAIVIASNYKFPANILSRGKGISFPMYDELSCQEMIEDFLLNFGMKNPSSNLISIIAANYVEEFGQKLFEELSPRTLTRYLEKYISNQDKRKMTLDASKSDVIQRPDAQIFYDTNIELMRSIYGESAIEEMRNQQLKNLQSKPNFW